MSHNISINLGIEPHIKLDSKDISITLTKSAISNNETAIPQLHSLLMMKQGTLKIPTTNQDILMKSFWEYIDALDRHVAVSFGITRPKTQTSSQFIELITNIKSKIKGLKVLELGTGSGILAIHLARCGAKVVAIDIVPDAVENARLNLFVETKKVQELVMLGVSDLYTNLSKITSEKQPKFDMLVFHNPAMLGSPTLSEHASFNYFAGTEFEVMKGTVSELPKVLNENGCAYLMVKQFFKNKANNKSVWTSDKLQESLPVGWTYDLACPWIEIDKLFGLAFSISRVLKKH